MGWEGVVALVSLSLPPYHTDLPLLIIRNLSSVSTWPLWPPHTPLHLPLTWAVLGAIWAASNTSLKYLEFWLGQHLRCNPITSHPQAIPAPLAPGVPSLSVTPLPLHSHPTGPGTLCFTRIFPPSSSWQVGQAHPAPGFSGSESRVLPQKTVSLHRFWGWEGSPGGKV